MHSFCTSKFGDGPVGLLQQATLNGEFALQFFLSRERSKQDIRQTPLPSQPGRESMTFGVHMTSVAQGLFHSKAHLRGVS